jgi:hypothetical protein
MLALDATVFAGSSFVGRNGHSLARPVISWFLDRLAIPTDPKGRLLRLAFQRHISVLYRTYDIAQPSAPIQALMSSTGIADGHGAAMAIGITRLTGDPTPADQAADCIGRLPTAPDRAACL